MKEEKYNGIINLGNKDFLYEIQYKKIKNMYMKIKDNKIIITASKKILISIIQDFIKQKEKWILKVIKKQENEIKVEKEKKYTEDEFINIIQEYVDEYSNKMKLHPNKVKIKSMKYAWGSCTSKKNISFNYELIYLDKDIIRYVIVHELSHLKYMNHQKEFWKLVEEYIPNYKNIRKSLKTYNVR